MQRTRNYNKGGEGASWGAPSPAAQQQQQGEVQYQSAEEVMEEARDEAYHMDTTGLSTTNFAPPPRLSAAPNTNPNPSSTRANPAPPPRVTGGYTKPAPSSFAPPPSGIAATSRATRPVPTPPPRLPARQNSNPNEYTPAPPPSYTAVVEEPEVAQPRGMAGGSAAAQVNELQARFARMNPGAGEAVGDGAGQAAMKKKPPPPPVKKAGLAAAAGGQGGSGGPPPPVPLGSRPKF